MNMFEAIPKKWGNSLGITIPRDIAIGCGLSPFKKVKVVLLPSNMERAKAVFGKLKLKRPTQHVMDEIDEGYD
ncbi:MAG TPA: hypothetical protein VJB12_05795 [Candidatus Nanoarchaeia archaeon]|nr:hypothetical protein [Candidatus Nanoarchaeia archaeon]